MRRVPRDPQGKKGLVCIVYPLHVRAARRSYRLGALSERRRRSRCDLGASEPAKRPEVAVQRVVELEALCVPYRHRIAQRQAALEIEAVMQHPVELRLRERGANMGR